MKQYKYNSKINCLIEVLTMEEPQMEEFFKDGFFNAGAYRTEMKIYIDHKSSLSIIRCKEKNFSCNDAIFYDDEIYINNEKDGYFAYLLYPEVDLKVLLSLLSDYLRGKYDKDDKNGEVRMKASIDRQMQKVNKQLHKYTIVQEWDVIANKAQEFGVLHPYTNFFKWLRENYCLTKVHAEEPALE